MLLTDGDLAVVGGPSSRLEDDVALEAQRRVPDVNSPLPPAKSVDPSTPVDAGPSQLRTLAGAIGKLVAATQDGALTLELGELLIRLRAMVGDTVPPRPLSCRGC